LFFFCGSGSFSCDKVKPKSRFTSPGYPLKTGQ
jgi:hypothetical protein